MTIAHALLRSKTETRCVGVSAFVGVYVCVFVCVKKRQKNSQELIVSFDVCRAKDNLIVACCPFFGARVGLAEFRVRNVCFRAATKTSPITFNTSHANSGWLVGVKLENVFAA